MAIQAYVYFEEMQYVDGILKAHNRRREILGTEAVAKLAEHAKAGKPEIVETVTERDGIAVTMFRFPEWDVEVTGMTAKDLREVYRAVKETAPKTKRGCSRCGGTGIYVWGGTINGKPMYEGICFKCWGSGNESRPNATGTSKVTAGSEDPAPKPKRKTGKRRPTIAREMLAALVASGQLTADEASLYLPRS